jgi:hypothetical protein
MARDSAIAVDNSFIGGLKTEFTGLNFPENACTETFNCVFDKTGLVHRRLGIDYEDNFSQIGTDRGSTAISKFLWKDANGDGTVSLLVVQMGETLTFYNASTATLDNPLSTTAISISVTVSDFLASGGNFDFQKECQYAEGNGFLFVYHPDCDPFYVSYSGGALTSTRITIKERDVTGILEEGIEDNYRPLSLTDVHKYNLANQGWNKVWSGTSTSSVTVGTGSKTFTTQAGLIIAQGDQVRITDATQSKIDINAMVGVVTSYSGTTLVVNVTQVIGSGTIASWNITPEPNFIGKWKGDVGNYPSSADAWHRFKNDDPTSSGQFEPSKMAYINLAQAGPAPKGFYILDAFKQQRATVSGIAGLTDVTTIARPSTGAWFAGRVWYAGINAKGYNEKIYFSQIIERTDQFGKCYQVNDPTSPNLFDILPSDGGVVKIQGMGKVFKLFPIVNGLLIFAQNGVWFITGSQGIGFTAIDYTVTQISGVPTISHTSFVDVQGNPFWWNEEGIYTIAPSQQGSLQVQSVTDASIATFYNDIPLASKKLARGAFNPITFQIQWLYRDTVAPIFITSYDFTRILNMDTQTGAFYPWTVSFNTLDSINDIVAIGGSGATNEPLFTFKYLTTSFFDVGGWFITFSEEYNEDYTDWATTDEPEEYESYFITGYRVYGQGIKDFQVVLLTLHSVGGEQTQCSLQARWDWSSSGNTGKWSTSQNLVFGGTGYSYTSRNMRIRGSGKSIQYKISSVDNSPMSLIGWSAQISANKVP